MPTFDICKYYTGFDRYLDCDLTIDIDVLIFSYLGYDALISHSWHWLCGKLTFPASSAIWQEARQGRPKERFRQNPNWPNIQPASYASTQMRQSDEDSSSSSSSSSKVLSQPKCYQLQLHLQDKVGGWSRILKFRHNPNWANQPPYLLPTLLPLRWDGSTDCSAEEAQKKKWAKFSPTSLHTAPLQCLPKISPI